MPCNRQAHSPVQPGDEYVLSKCQRLKQQPQVLLITSSSPLSRGTDADWHAACHEQHTPLFLKAQCPGEGLPNFLCC